MEGRPVDKPCSGSRRASAVRFGYSRLVGGSCLPWSRHDGRPTLFFPGKGISVGFKDGVVTSFAAYVAASPEEGMGRFSGWFRYRGRRLDLCEETTERELIAIFGSPYRRDQDEDEVILFYEFGEYEPAAARRELGMSVGHVYRPLRRVPRHSDPPSSRLFHFARFR